MPTPLNTKNCDICCEMFVVNAIKVNVFPPINPMMQITNSRFIIRSLPFQTAKSRLEQTLIFLPLQSIQDDPTST